jgi:deoxycytidine triphosphate deaminase
MSTLTRKKIVERLSKGELLTNVRIKEDGTYDVEAASYDLAVGIGVSKKGNKKIFQKRNIQFEFDPSKKKQETITLGAGQMAYVITHEEILMPDDLCGTVYSRNSLALKGILALNTGHIDPGYHGPITIKIINLRSVDYTLTMGDAIFTIAFHSIERDRDDKDTYYRRITKAEILKRVLDASDISLNNALYDLALLREFVKEDEFGRAFRKWITKTVWGAVTTIFTLLLTLIGATYSVYKLLEATGILTIIKERFK